ncbi:MAG TPA: Fe-S cluster assembly protein SufB [Candidatus Omnitrophota bacterium]|nr:Fe-S cluster assembly protein SufB [Candidatus Omnitrophota bacterium]HPB68241.1 Fe-S cluster assembly protein SufB [Candidatus Omnitrophota bacterium]HQO58931.1 Fe-S cluster assembly protein SufB [Candidatus Omnitrophota bacterium]
MDTHSFKKNPDEKILKGNKLAGKEYQYGFYTPVDAELAPRGLNEDIIRFISQKKDEPAWMLEWRLKAFRHWQTMTEPHWAYFHYDPIDYQSIHYYSAPKKKAEGTDNEGEIDPEVARTFDRLGIPVSEQKRLSGVAVDAVFDSVSVGTTHQSELARHGIIFCPISEAVQKHPDLVRKYLGSVVPYTDNFFAALNSAVFTDGSFCFIPQGVRCPIELSTYFRINAAQTGQFERTLIIAEDNAYVSYLEGCTAPTRDENQLHAAVVELVALENAEIKYSTVQNWYSGDQDGRGGIYNFVTKRGQCRGNHSKISWTQVEAGSAITWKYPSLVLQGDHATGEFYSVALTNHRMQADTGTKMIHIGKKTRSTIISKGISSDQANNSYRGLVKILPSAEQARNFSRCDSMLVGNRCSANTFPSIEVNNRSATVEHEASTSRINADQIFYHQSRGLNTEAAISLIINGFCKEVFQELPMEFAVEAVKLLELKLEGSVG